MSENPGEPAKRKRRPKQESQIPPINWKADNCKLEWALLDGMLDPKNFKTIFGQEKGENTTKEPKIVAYRRIAASIVPEAAKISETESGSRCKSRGDNLISVYKEQAKRLRQTGDGIRDPDSPSDVYLVDYIGADGPNESNTDEIKNIWDEINRDFPFFSTMYRRIAQRPNMTPPSVTTGVGPHGRTVTHLQPPEVPGFDNSVIDPELLSQSHSMDASDTLRSDVAAPVSPPAGSQFTEAGTRSPLARIQPKVKQTPAKPSTFVMDSAIQNAKSQIKKASASKKRSIEEVLSDLMHDQQKHALQRQNRLDEMHNREMAHKERDQILQLFRAGLLTKEEAHDKLREIDGVTTPTKSSRRSRFRSPSLDLPPTSPARGSSPVADNIERNTLMCRSYSGPLDGA